VQKAVSVKRVVFVYLMLYAAVITMLAYIVLHGSTVLNNPIVTVVCLAIAVSITLYTAHHIIQTVLVEIKSYAVKIAKFSNDMQSVSKRLIEYAIELNQREIMMDERQRVFEQNVGIISNYGRTMKELVATIENAADSAVQNPLPVISKSEQKANRTSG
jgi:hypothetical protein